MHNIYSAPSRVQGTGAFSKRDFKKGDRVTQYTGELISEEEADRRHANRTNTYLFDLGDGTVIDATESSNPAKYINHSCQPNCESEQEDDEINIYAITDIQADQELFYDYNLVQDEDDEDIEQCNCAAPSCTGILKAKH